MARVPASEATRKRLNDMLAAEAFRYFILEQGEAHLMAHDAALLQRGESGL